ncbi:molybdopterin oxidoreductase [bacterium (Candidatus Blackallbacteria) CG17_big_fil_post_rev_8_21_14_2_50_48_46]|uniref:Molybdopterin oxidoreductase n=1 Tax=bacterium (Candidatus Blackallbacteria) CG17_big_fil_post_rev_8_21_14_2_50_48_46 TaxID=2014261 RepID=A0A2M7G024_9BACT|nr:MAG: molybdopterin oxidoreductase [bacterium (Candidatus Blackallbacteria) CG18_big_fil_WC_8_21_14_2_50_49_26]PIW15032.1 MAG: molybdopterin oxidoreductase [bacterium (Candidatus Blackallbacteria) CG17_big_fil_post_rev_8_21_14_2_50_48_46]PIW47645.1 MAG: molybdopterin oxidoreductase [bacterium (Candidatus Blackallbacteria) CG13_big_fil_rev_8_21_14_2_50_49_14]
MSNSMNRLSFLKRMAAWGAAIGVSGCASRANNLDDRDNPVLRYFKPLQVENPLKAYPNRGWENVYRNLFQHDSDFSFLCAPNDTHNCLLKTYVKNGIAIRIGPTYGYGKAKDLYGQTASHRWDPRLCQKGLGLVRRIYGDRRLKAPMIRKGYKAWVDAGFPRDRQTGKPDPKYFQRGKDAWLRIDWKDAYSIAAKALSNIAETYHGETGQKRLLAQGYDDAMVLAMEGSGTQTIKLRGGMAPLGATRIFGMYRMANSLALMDAKQRKVSPEKSFGARGWDSYSWHTDLPPGHPMVTGAQTNDFELFSVEHSKLAIAWGMNWITTKMPDSHWLTEARLKGTKTVTVTVEYSATASKTDEVIVIRPGSDPAFALGLAQVIIERNLFDSEFVKTKTDLPFLIRLDTLQPLRPEDVIKDYKTKVPKNLDVLIGDEKPPANVLQKDQFIKEKMGKSFQPYMIWDSVKSQVMPVTRDDWGKNMLKLGLNPDLNAVKKVKLVSGKEVEVRTVFDLTRQYLNQNFTPEQTSQITTAPVSGILSLATQIAANKEKTLFVTGMGPNQFFNADLKDRAIFLVAALTRNLGFPGGNVGSYAGNYRGALFGGEPLYTLEDPFHPQLDPKGKVSTAKYSHYESLHYFNYGDRPLRMGKHLLTGESHLPVPTKAMWLNNSNSVLGNIKWHFDVINNTLPKLEFVAYADWWWTGSCEYADLVFACDSWAEFRHPDLTASCTNPFVQVYPTSPLKRIFDTRSDIEIIAGVGKALAQELDEPRLAQMWEFVEKDQVDVYLQRIINGTSALKGYTFEKLHLDAKEGIPALMNNRTYPRLSSYEQVHDEKPWHTKSGRLEFYRFEPEFVENGENLVVYREPIDSTHYEPNVIVSKPHPAIRPKQPADYGVNENQLDTETRQARHVVRTGEELLKSKHPLKAQQFSHVYHTPKYRHGAHTTPVDTDFTGVWFGPFGDIYRHDKRNPSVIEGYVDINPLDAKELGVDDGDYVYIDADPGDRPYRDHIASTEAYKVARLLLRARYYPGTPRGVARTWHNMYGATFGSVKGHETREDGLAKNPETNYQSMYRYGSHQSATRAWLKPTLMTESLVHKSMFGQGLAKGFEPDIHCPVGAPREAFVKITRAASGGLDAKGKWRPVTLGFRPTYESKAMKTYLKGQFTGVKR